MAEVILIVDNETEEKSASNSNSKKRIEPKPTLQNAVNGNHKQVVAPAPCPSQNWETIPMSSFDSFISVCKKQTKDPDMLKIIRHLCKSHTRASPEFTQSVKFLDFLHSLQTKIQENPSNVFVYVKELSDELKAYKAHSNNQTLTDKHSDHNSDKPLNGNFSQDVKVLDRNLNSTIHSVPSTSAAVISDSKSLETAGVATNSKKKEPKERHIAFLEWQLRRLEKKIKKLSERELNFDDMDDEESHYILEDRYKKRAVKVWQTLCKYQGRDAISGRATDRKFNYAGSRYPEINKIINRSLNKHKTFPDFTDIVRLIETAVTHFKLPMKGSQIHTEAQSVFTDVGKMLRANRLTEFEELLCSYDPEEDPARTDEELAKMLDESAMKGQQKIEEILSTYVAKQQELMGDHKKKNKDNDNEEIVGERCSTPDNLRDDCCSGDSEDEDDGKTSEEDLEKMAQEFKDEVDSDDLNAEANTVDGDVVESETDEEENEDYDDSENLLPSIPNPTDCHIDISQAAVKSEQPSSDILSKVSEDIMAKYRQHSDSTAKLKTDKVTNFSPVSVQKVSFTHPGVGSRKRQLDFDAEDDSFRVKREQMECMSVIESHEVSVIESHEVITISDSD